MYVCSKIFLAICLLLSGGAITVFQRIFFNNTAENCHRKDVPFIRPLFFSWVLAVGQLLAFIFYFIQLCTKYRGKSKPKDKNAIPYRYFDWIKNLLPAVLDFLAQIGINLSLVSLEESTPDITKNLVESNSVEKTIRAVIIICTTIITLIFMKRKLKWYNWVGVFLAIFGLLCFGIPALIDILVSKDGYPKADWWRTFVGCVCAVGAQVLWSIQTVLQDSFVHSGRMNPLSQVSWEGFWLVILTTGYMAGAHFMPKYELTTEGYGLKENVCDTAKSLVNNPHLFAYSGVIAGLALIFSIASICFIKGTHGLARQVTVQLRTVLSWAAFFVVYVAWKKKKDDIYDYGNRFKNDEWPTFVEAGGAALLLLAAIFYHGGGCVAPEVDESETETIGSRYEYSHTKLQAEEARPKQVWDPTLPPMWQISGLKVEPMDGYGEGGGGEGGKEHQPNPEEQEGGGEEGGGEREGGGPNAALERNENDEEDDRGSEAVQENGENNNDVL